MHRTARNSQHPAPSTCLRHLASSASAGSIAVASASALSVKLAPTGIKT